MMMMMVMICVVHQPRTPAVQDARATKAACGQAVGVAGVAQHEPGGTDVSQPSCMTSRCDLSLSTPKSQPGEGVGATCSGSRRSLFFFFFVLSHPLYPLKNATEPAGASSTGVLYAPSSLVSAVRRYCRDIALVRGLSRYTSQSGQAPPGQSTSDMVVLVPQFSV